jgi:hypothetical protein
MVLIGAYMDRCAVVNAETHEVVNVIIIEGELEGHKWQPPKGHYAIKDLHCDIGDKYHPQSKKLIKNIVIAKDS